MDRNPAMDDTTEVIGIVISRGRQTDTPPRFKMYVWGPAPDAEPDTDTKAA